MSFNVLDYIVLLNDVVPMDLCDEVLSEYGGDKNWSNATVMNGLHRDIRRCDLIDMSNKLVIQQNENKRQDLDKRLFDCAALVIKKYNEKFPFTKIERDSGYTLLRYKENEFYVEHTDHYLKAPRTVSCSFAVNDDYEGGEFAFFERELKYKIPKGSALMFPSNFMYPHEIMPVTSGIRYSIITWFV